MLESNPEVVCAILAKAREFQAIVSPTVGLVPRLAHPSMIGLRAGGVRWVTRVVVAGGLLSRCGVVWAQAVGAGHAGGLLSHTWPVLFVLLLFLATSAVFSGSEIALVSLSAPRVAAMVDAGVRGSTAVQHLKRRPNRMLITILLGNNLVNIGASVLAAAWTTMAFGSAALGYATAALTLLVLVFGEIFPKTIAQQHAERFACIMARPLLVLQAVVFPLIWLLEWVLVVSMRYTRVRARLQLDAAVELKATMDMLSREGKLEDSLQHLMSGTFSFGKKRVSEIMTPRSRIVAIEHNAPLAALRRLFLAGGVTRIPVFQEQLDVIRGVVSMHMLLQAEQDRRALVGDIGLLPAVMVAPTMYVDDLLLRLQAEKQHLAVVAGKAGRVVGVVTMENALEEIVGEMFDEEDRFRVFVHRRGKQRWEVTADCPIYEFRNYFRGFEPVQPPFKSVEALYLEKAVGQKPTVGARVEGDGYAMEVVDMKENRIVRLLIEQTI